MGRCRSFSPPCPTAGRVIARILGKALLWAITAALATAILFEVFGISIPVILALRAGGSPTAWAVWGFWSIVPVLALVLGAQLPLVFLMGTIWTALVRRQPHVDQTRRGFLLGCLIVSLPATLIAGAPQPSNLLRDLTARSGISIAVAALILIVLGFLGVLLPRLIIPGLKQGQLIPPLAETAQEPVR
jgi:hypothetical protein